MNSLRLWPRRWARWGFFLGLWTLVVLFFATQIHFIVTAYGGQVTWSRAAYAAMRDWYSWALLSPVIYRVCRQSLAACQTWLAHVGAQLVAGTGLSVVHLEICALVELLWTWLVPRHLYAPYNLYDPLQRVIVTRLQSDLFAYTLIVSVWYAANYYRKYREKEVQTAELETRLAQAQLHALKMQLHPHFMFNTLHAISALIHESPKAADRMITRLSDLLRLALENSGVQEVSLKQELVFLENYLEIEKVRMGDRLEIQIDIPEELQPAKVPNLMLQPLVENAIRHGIAPFARPGSIAIRARRHHDSLLLRVCDNGPGLPPGESGFSREGLGLSNCRARLRHLYGEAQKLELSTDGERGLRVEVTLPLRFREGESALLARHYA